jgi:hypothetical protein
LVVGWYLERGIGMMIEIDAETLDGIARAWLEETLSILEQISTQRYVHPDDAETYAADIEAVKRLLAYIGE